MSDVITLESDDEGDFSEGADLVVGPNGTAVPISQVRGQGLPWLPRPPGRPMQVQGMPRAMAPGQRIPKKPGTFPPFALFSQEHRPQLMNENQNISFADVGKRLGEMWHSLSEDEKEEYRRRSRAIADQKLREWHERMKMFPPHQQASNLVAQVSSQKRRRTHGYAIFSSEMRKKFAESIPMTDTTKMIAEKWRNASPALRQAYESRAAKINEAEAKKHQQLLLQSQRRQQQFQFQQQQQILMKQQQHQQQQALRARLFPGTRQPPSSQNGSGLRITSVSSLKRASPGVNLPSSITVSRVEPEVSIVEEEEELNPITMANLPPGLSIHRNNAPPPLTRGGALGGNPLLARGRGQALVQRNRQLQLQQQQLQQQQQFLQLQQKQQQLAFQRQQLSNVLQRPMRGMAASRGMAMQRSMAMKRPLMMQGGLLSDGSSNKQPRLVMRPAPARQVVAKTANKPICRLCALPSPFAEPLSDKPETLDAINFVLDMNIDFVQDKQEEYPDSICRRCCTVLSTFSTFKKNFEAGQIKLNELIDKKKKESMPKTTIISEVEASQMSILPDLDCEVDEGETMLPFPISINKEEEKEENERSTNIDEAESEVTSGGKDDFVVIDPLTFARVDKVKSDDADNIVADGEQLVGDKEEEVTDKETNEDGTMEGKEDAKSAEINDNPDDNDDDEEEAYEIESDYDFEDNNEEEVVENGDEEEMENNSAESSNVVETSEMKKNEDDDSDQLRDNNNESISACSNPPDNAIVKKKKSLKNVDEADAINDIEY